MELNSSTNSHVHNNESKVHIATTLAAEREVEVNDMDFSKQSQSRGEIERNEANWSYREETNKEKLNELATENDHNDSIREDERADRTSQDSMMEYYDSDESDNDEPEDSQEQTDEEYAPPGEKRKPKETFPCNYCNLIYKSQASRYNHMMKSHKAQYISDRKLMKQENNQKTDSQNTRKSLNAVQSALSYGTEFPCDHCTFSYAKYSSWWQHVKSHHKGNGLASQKERIRQLSNMKSRKDESSRTSANYTDASIEDKEEPTTSKIVNRRSQVAADCDQNEFDCDHCSMSFATKMGKSRHIQIVHPEMEELRKKALDEVFVCTYCSKEYESYKSVYIHIGKKHPNRVRPSIHKLRHRRNNTSMTENTAETTEITAEQEISNNSSVDPPLKCDKCTKIFATVDFLNKHKLIHVKPAEPAVPARVFCDNCGQVFKGQPYLERHLNHTECGANSKNLQTSSESKSLDANRRESSKRASSSVKIVDNTTDSDHIFTPPAIKRFCNVERTQQRTVSVTRAKDVEIVEVPVVSPSPKVKQEQSDILEYDNATITPTYIADASGRTPIVKNEPNEINVENRPVVPRASTIAVWKGLFSIKKEPVSREIKQKKIVARIVKDNDNSDDCMIIEPKNIKPKKYEYKTREEKVVRDSPSIISDITNCSSRRQSMNSNIDNSFTNDLIEKCPLPLSAAIFSRSIQNPKELMIIWSTCLEEDLLASVSLNTATSVLCIQELQVLKLTEQHKETLEKSNLITFNILTSNDTTSQWTVISFGEDKLDSLKNKLFKRYTDVERAFSEHAAKKDMTINNVMRYSKYGLFPVLSQNLVQKITAFNSTA